MKLSKKKIDTLTQLKSYFPHYSNATLEGFIKANNLLVEYWRENISELERENVVIREEIERRQSEEGTGDE